MIGRDLRLEIGKAGSEAEDQCQVTRDRWDELLDEEICSGEICITEAFESKGELV